MKRSIQYIAYFIPILFAVICLAWFCKVHNCTNDSLNKADYANHGKMSIKHEQTTIPSTYSPPRWLPFLKK